MSRNTCSFEGTPMHYYKPGQKCLCGRFGSQEILDNIRSGSKSFCKL